VAEPAGAKKKSGGLSGAGFVVIAVFVLVLFLVARGHHNNNAPTAGPSQHRLSSSDYKALKNAYEGWHASFVGLLNGSQSVKDMQFDTTYTIQTTPSSDPGGTCGTKLNTYRGLLHGYENAVYVGAAYGPPSFATVSQAEERVEEACQPTSG